MKKTLLILGALSALTLAGCEKEIVIQDGAASQHTISVSGQAVEEVKPDVGYIHLGVTVENKDTEVARQQAAEIMTNVISKLKELGVKEDEVETTNFSVDLIRDYRSNELTTMSSAQSEIMPAVMPLKPDLPHTIVGYSVQNQVKITVNDLEKISNIVDVVSSEQNVTVHNLSFSLKDKEAAKNLVVEEAIKNAKKQAEAVAKSLDLKVKGVHKVNVGNSGQSFYANDMAYAESAVMKSTPISPSDVEINASVNVEFIIE